MSFFMYRYWFVIPAGEGKFEVKNGLEGFAVDEGEKVCTCRGWQLSGIPCAHAMAAIMYLNKHPDFYVSHWYSKDIFQVTYNHTLGPINGSSMWPQTTFTKPLPPLVRTMPGRPKRKRKRDVSEGRMSNKVSSVGRILNCRRCNQPGHNISTCKGTAGEESNQGEGDAGSIGRGRGDAGSIGKGRGRAGSIGRGGRGAGSIGRGGRGAGRGRARKALEQVSMTSPLPTQQSAAQTNTPRGGRSTPQTDNAGTNTPHFTGSLLPTQHSQSGAGTSIPQTDNAKEIHQSQSTTSTKLPVKRRGKSQRIILMKLRKGPTEGPGLKSDDAININ